MNNKQLDFNLLGGYLTNLGKQTVNKMLELYEQQSKVYLLDIEQALVISSQQLWQEHCHKMKGASASVGLTQVNSLLVVMEKSNKEETLKAEDIKQLKSLNEAAITAFTQWLATID